MSLTVGPHLGRNEAHVRRVALRQVDESGRDVYAFPLSHANEKRGSCDPRSYGLHPFSGCLSSSATYHQPKTWPETPFWPW